MSYYSEAIEKIRRLDAELMRKGDPDLTKMTVTDGQRSWLLHLGLSRALEILGEVSRAPGCPHKRILVRPGDETFLPQRGCLDCNTWLDPVRVL